MDYRGAKSFILGKLEQELMPIYTYHGKHHTLDVLSVTEELCALEDIGSYETKLLKTAALFHDAGFINSPTNHETTSCNIAKEVLPSFDYSEIEIERICGMIMATKIPQSPQNNLEQILADADLDYLGREDFFAIGNTLFEELSTLGILKTENEWNRLQVKFLEAHRFHTATNVQRREPAKRRYIDKIKMLISEEN
jgi:uncharacterized protein